MVHGLQADYPKSATIKHLQSQRQSMEARITKMSIIIVIIFVVCNSFESILFILHSQEILRRDVGQDYLRSIGDVLMVFNSSVNAIIYGAVSSKFRSTFLQIFCCKGEENKSKISKTDSSNVVIPNSKLPRNMNLNLTSQHSNITTRSLSPVSTPVSTPV